MPLSHMSYDINLNRSNSDCTTRQTDLSPFVRLSVERTSMRRKKVMHIRILVFSTGDSLHYPDEFLTAAKNNPSITYSKKEGSALFANHIRTRRILIGK